MIANQTRQKHVLYTLKVAVITICQTCQLVRILFHYDSKYYLQNVNKTQITTPFKDDIGKLDLKHQISQQIIRVMFDFSGAGLVV